MAKLKDDPVTKNDINEYIKEYSDFSFEVKVLKKLISLGFNCDHAGTYEDPITKKTREFDIRAKKCLIDEPKFKLNICLSVECKNLRNNFPLVVHCMPRQKNECYLDLIWAYKSDSPSVIPKYSMRVPLKDEASPYKQLDAVGKSCDQVGRRATQSGEIIGNDGDVFEKISQAINAGYDLIQKAHYEADKGIDVISIVVPVLIVPNNSVWSVWYNLQGEIEREPTQESNVEYYLNKSWLVGNSSAEYSTRYYISHLEIAQIDSIKKMIDKYTENEAISSSEKLKLLQLEVLEQSMK